MDLNIIPNATQRLCDLYETALMEATIFWCERERRSQAELKARRVSDIELMDDFKKTLNEILMFTSVKRKKN